MNAYATNYIRKTRILQPLQRHQPPAFTRPPAEPAICMPRLLVVTRSLSPGIQVALVTEKGFTRTLEHHKQFCDTSV